MSQKESLVVNCPCCKKSVTWALSPHRPFCSQQCKVIDLGDWASGSHCIAGDSLSPDEDPVTAEKMSPDDDDETFQ